MTDGTGVPEGDEELDEAHRRAMEKHDPVRQWWRQLLVWDTDDGRWETDAEIDFDRTVEDMDVGLPWHEVTAARSVIARHYGDFYWVALDDNAGLFRTWEGQVWEGEANAGRIFAWVSRARSMPAKS